MRKLKATAALTLVLLLAAYVLPAIPAEVVELVVVSRGVPDKVVSIGKGGPSQGDMNLWSQPLLDGKEEEQIGMSDGYCVRVSPTEPVHQCSFTLKMKKGSVYIAATQTGSGPFEGGIIGGTGEYANARGEVKYSSNEDLSKWTYNLKISK